MFSAPFPLKCVPQGPKLDTGGRDRWGVSDPSSHGLCRSSFVVCSVATGSIAPNMESDPMLTRLCLAVDSRPKGIRSDVEVTTVSRWLLSCSWFRMRMPPHSSQFCMHVFHWHVNKFFGSSVTRAWSSYRRKQVSIDCNITMSSSSTPKAYQPESRDDTRLFGAEKSTSSVDGISGLACRSGVLVFALSHSLLLSSHPSAPCTVSPRCRG